MAIRKNFMSLYFGLADIFSIEVQGYENNEPPERGIERLALSVIKKIAHALIGRK